MNTTQQTLSKSLEKSAEKYIPETRINELNSTIKTLQAPEPTRSAFDYTAWNQFITEISGSEALKLRENYSKQSKKHTILTTIAGSKLSEPSYVDEAFPIKEYGNPQNELHSKTIHFILQTTKKYPLSVLLSNWITEISICDRNSIHELVGRKTAGFYHPDEHWIAISRDSGDKSKYWPVAKKKPSEHYERSVTIHELGHALHYMFGLQTKGSETVDNRNTLSIDETKLTLKQDCIQTQWQYKFVYHCAKAYALLLDKTYETLSYTDYQLKTIEEMFAEGFNAYITSPRHLSQVQPLTHTICKTYSNR